MQLKQCLLFLFVWPFVAVLSAQTPKADCFDAEAIAAACTPVYLRVNIHFFVQNDCQGDIQSWGTNQVNAFTVAEALVEQANNELANNPEQWPRHEPSLHVCVPIRYVLQSVHEHCLSGADGRSQLSSLHRQFKVGADSVYNIYIAVFPGSSNGQALHTFATIEDQSTRVFNHEIGHLLNLNHSFELNDGCDDTPHLRFDWDKNCDGKISADEKNLKCWNLYEADPDSTIVRNDQNKNGRDDCREISPCNPFPCCNWDVQHNNIMSHSNYQSAYTQCQVGRMLEHINKIECQYVAQVGGACPPPSAYITQTAYDAQNEQFCAECLVLRSSFNETAHRLDIFEGNVPMQGKVAFRQPWINAPATDFCFSTHAYSGIPHLKPQKPYTAMLIVRNACGVLDTAVYRFQTPAANVQMDKRSSLPLTSALQGTTLQIQLDATKEARACLIAVREDGYVIRGLNRIKIKNGKNTVTIDTRKWPKGKYRLTLLMGENIFQGEIGGI